MEERLTFTLNISEIENLLFEYYFGNSKSKEQIEKTLKMDYKIIKKQSIGVSITNIIFILSYQESSEILETNITQQLVVELKDLNDIINEKFSNQGFEIDYLEENIKYAFDEKHALNYIKYNLKRKEKAKLKKRGWKKNV